MDFGIAETGFARGSPPGATTEVLRVGFPFAEIQFISAVAPCRRIRVARASVRAAMPSRRRAPQHKRTVTLEARLGLWPFSCAGPPARPPHRLRHHGLAVTGCLAHVDAEEGAPPS
jgi:hypothetical protein